MADTNSTLNARVVALCVGIASIAFLVLFEVRIDLDFSRAREILVADAAQEARFAACVEARDREIHRDTFGAIDNPDVQREVLKTEKEKAVAACRELFPAVLVRESRPLRFNLLDIEFRY